MFCLLLAHGDYGERVDQAMRVVFASRRPAVDGRRPSPMPCSRYDAVSAGNSGIDSISAEGPQSVAIGDGVAVIMRVRYRVVSQA